MAWQGAYVYHAAHCKCLWPQLPATMSCITCWGLHRSHSPCMCNHQSRHKARKCIACWGLCCQLRSFAQVQQQSIEWALVIWAGLGQALPAAAHMG